MGSIKSRMALRRPWLARHSSKFVMQCLFRPLFGWRDSEQHGLEYFSFIGRDMSKLEAARKLARGKHTKGVVLLCHPFLKFGMSYFFKNSYDEKLNQAGYHVVSFNFKGFGASTVESMNFADDVASIVDWARHTYPDLPLHFWGVSFGAFHGMHAIGSGRARFDSALFDSAPVSLVHFFGKGALGLVMRSLSRSRWGNLTGTHDVFQSFPLPAELPRLYMFGEDDAFITSHELHRLQESVGHECIRRFANCGHLEIRKTYQDEYFGQALAFLDQHSQTKPALALA